MAKNTRPISKKDFFKRVKDMARREGVKGVRKKAIDFFRSNVKRLGKSITGSKLIRMKPENLRSKGNLAIGKMYFFMYDPKLKKKLPYYDRFPLIFVLTRKGTKSGAGFLGLNLHYLSPKDRAIFLANLIEITNNKKYDETTRLKVTYGMLKSTAKLSRYKPTIKQYLNKHVKSRFLMIPADDWIIATFLPTAQFEKASPMKVWADSRKMF